MHDALGTLPGQRLLYIRERVKSGRKRSHIMVSHFRERKMSTCSETVSIRVRRYEKFFATAEPKSRLAIFVIGGAILIVGLSAVFALLVLPQILQNRKTEAVNSTPIADPIPLRDEPISPPASEPIPATVPAANNALENEEPPQQVASRPPTPPKELVESLEAKERREKERAERIELAALRKREAAEIKAAADAKPREITLKELHKLGDAELKIMIDRVNAANDIPQWQELKKLKGKYLPTLGMMNDSIGVLRWGTIHADGWRSNHGWPLSRNTSAEGQYLTQLGRTNCAVRQIVSDRSFIADVNGQSVLISNLDTKTLTDDQQILDLWKTVFRYVGPTRWGTRTLHEIRLVEPE